MTTTTTTTNPADNGCTTVPSGWKDPAGENCSYYAKQSLCTTTGKEGPLWHSGDGPLRAYATQGISALGACCECGGGSMSFAIKTASNSATRPTPFGPHAATHFLHHAWQQSDSSVIFDESLCAGVSNSAGRPSPVPARECLSRSPNAFSEVAVLEYHDRLNACGVAIFQNCCAHRARRTGKTQWETRVRRTRSNFYVLPLVVLGIVGAHQTACSQTTASVAWVRVKPVANAAAALSQPLKNALWRLHLLQHWQRRRQRSRPWQSCQSGCPHGSQR